MKPILISAALLLILLVSYCSTSEPSMLTLEYTLKYFPNPQVVSEVSSAPVVDEVSSSTAVETLNSPLNRNAASCHRLIQTNQQTLLFSQHLPNSRWCFTDLIFHDDWLHHKFQFLLLEPQTRSLLVPSSWRQWKRRMSALAETLIIIMLKYTNIQI